MTSVTEESPFSKAWAGRLVGTVLFVSFAAWQLVDFIPLLAAATAPFWQRFHAAVVLLVMVALTVVALRDAAAAGPVSLERRVLALFLFPLVAGYQFLWVAPMLIGKLMGLVAVAAVVYLMVADFRSVRRVAPAHPAEGPQA
jgi:hypothetical protein